jgi:hypothetical protein
VTCSGGDVDHGGGGGGGGGGGSGRGGGLVLEENGADGFAGEDVLLRGSAGVNASGMFHRR